MLRMRANFYNLTKLHALSAAIIVSLCLPALACDRPALISPDAVEIVAPSPRIEWSAVADASHYLIRIESRVPEGRVLWSEEFRTEATFLALPRPLTADKATVRIEMTTVCKDGTQGRVVQRVRVDPRPACRIDIDPVVERREGKPVLVWPVVVRAQSYEVRAHSVTDGKPAQAFETRTTVGSLDRLPAGLWVLAVQPICGAARGESRYITAALP